MPDQERIETPEELLDHILYVASHTGGIHAGVHGDAQLDRKMSPELEEEVRRILDGD